MNLYYIFLIIIVVILVLYYLIKNKYINTEPFVDTHNRYLACREKGYSKQYCLQSPYSRYPMFQCTCKNGLLGQRLPGIKQRCSCDYLDPAQNYLKDIYI